MAEVALFSFFSGCGILDFAFEQAGFNIVFVNEFSEKFMTCYKFARNALKKQAPIYGYKVESAERYSVRRGKRQLKRMIENEKRKGRMVGFIGGPPCPDFSVGGKNAGADGENGRLTRVYFNIITRCRPDFFIFENVKGLIKTEKHKVFYEEMKFKVQGSGYVISDRLLNSLQYGVPQFRERIIMIGVKPEFLNLNNIAEDNTLQFNWQAEQNYDLDVINAIRWPERTPFGVDSIAIKPHDIIEELTVEYWFKKNNVYEHFNAQDIFRVKAGYSKINDLQEGDTRGKSFKRLHRWRYSPTAAYGHNEVHLHPYKARRLSVAEAMAIQSLPSSFILPKKITLSDKFKMISNGVPYLMAYAIAKTLMAMFDDIVEERRNNHAIEN